MTVERFALQLPTDLTPHGLASFISTACSAVAAKQSAVIIGLTATKHHTDYWLEVDPGQRAVVLAQLKLSMPGVRISARTLPIPDFTLVTQLRLSTNERPLNLDAAVGAALAAATQSLHHGETVQWQLMLTGCRSPRPVHSGSAPDDLVRSARQLLGLSVDQHVSDGRNRQDLLNKQQHPLLAGLGILAVHTATRQRDRAVIGSALAGLRTAEAPGLRLKVHAGWQYWQHRRLVKRSLPMGGWPLRLNSVEAAVLLGWPTAELAAHLTPARSRFLPVAQIKPTGITVGRTQDGEGKARDLVLPQAARIMHTHVIGGTGVGKSTVLAQLALQDIAAGRATVVLDPKRDLVNAILERVPAGRADNVVLFDPSTSRRVIGMNPLGWGSPERTTDFLVHVMHGLFARSWGPRTADVLRTGVLSLTLAGNYSLVDLPTLLTDPLFRSRVQAALPPHPLLAEYWRWFEALSPPHQAEITAPLLSRLRSLLLVGPLHQILSQTNPAFDFDSVFRKRLTVLVPLSAGQLGEEGAGLLGSLIVARLWQLTQARSGLPPHARHPVMLYLDEFHQYLHLPTSMAEALAQARGLGVGLTLAHQHLDQLTPEVRSAVLTNARNRIVFQLASKDATALATDMSPLTADDLKNLSSHEIYLRTMHGSAVQRPASGYTSPLTMGNARTAGQIRKASLYRFGQPIIAQPENTTPEPLPIGHKPPVDGSSRGAT